MTYRIEFKINNEDLILNATVRASNEEMAEKELMTHPFFEEDDIEILKVEEVKF